MTRPPSVLRPALALMNARLVLQQIGLALLVVALSAVWLRVPDASVADVTGSALLALIVLATAGTGQAAIVLRLSGYVPAPARLLRGALLLLAGAALWFAWATLINHLHSADSLRAGYLNSRFLHSLRNFLSFDNILLWLGWMWVALAWIGGGAIALVAFTATASRRPLEASSRALRCPTYWIAVLFGATAATAISGSLMRWTPGHGLRVEALSLLLRLTLALLVDGTVVCLLMAILAVSVRRTDAIYFTPEGTPEESHPRTVDHP